MTLAELVLVVAGVIGIYRLLRPLQRRLEHYLIRKFGGHSREHVPTIDIVNFRSHQKEDDEHDNDS